MDWVGGGEDGDRWMCDGLSLERREEEDEKEDRGFLLGGLRWGLVGGQRGGIWSRGVGWLLVGRLWMEDFNGKGNG